MVDERKRMKPSKAQQWANDATGKAFRGATTLADRFAGGAGTRAALSGAGSAINRLSDDAGRNTALRQSRRLEIPYGDQAQRLDSWKQGVESRRFDREQPTKPTGAMQPTPRSSVSQPGRIPSLEARQKGEGRIMLTNRFNPEGEVLGNLSAFKQSDRSLRARFDRKNSSNSSPYDVQFDPSVSQEARDRFNADPVRPTAQIDRFNARRQASMVQPVQEQGPPKQPKLYTIEDAPKVGGPRARADLNKELMDNYRAELNAFNNLQGKRIDDSTARQRNDIEAQNVQGLNQFRGAQTATDFARTGADVETSQFDLEQKQKIEGLRSELFSENTSDDRKKQINEMLRSYSGEKSSSDKYRPVEVPTFDEMGNQTGVERFSFNEGDGVWSRADGQEADPVMSIIESNPAYLESWEKMSEADQKARYQQVLEWLQSQRG